ncbi:MAG: type II toxin-antitoxin system VapC family toxin [Gemmataceae bacterium]
MSFLLDTDICSAHFKGNRLVTARFLQYTGQLYLSTIVCGELYTWVARKAAPLSRLQSFNDLLIEAHVLDIDQSVATKFGQVRAGLFDHGLNVSEMDLLIAATALVHDLTLVTHNIADYVKVPGLRLVDWLVP